MKTLTSTLAIFALLFSVTTFGTNLNDIEPIKLPRDPGSKFISNMISADIEPIKLPRNPDPYTNV